MAKGAAMLSPAMATMLAVVTTDAAVDPSTLRTHARRAPSTDTFDSLIVDDCTSTNDTVLLLANGRARATRRSTARAERTKPSATGSRPRAPIWRAQMAADTEGAT